MKVDTLSALRRAGFPLTPVDEIFERLDIQPVAESKIPEVFPAAYKIAGHWYLKPTLEQLFTSLGTYFNLLERTDVWGAIGHVNGQQKLATGDSPEEALAKLYLEIRK